MIKQEFKPFSLTQHFEPPKGYVGRFGWICGYSADPEFLKLAAERFTGAAEFRRAHSGDIFLTLILDPSAKQLSLESVPGVLHLPFRNTTPRPFRLMHAKVALLGYRAESGDNWVVRLLVCTGNWTRGTLEMNLDLVWLLEVKSEDLRARPDPRVRQACADVRAAWGLFEFLRGQYDEGALTAKLQNGRPASWHWRMQELSLWIKQASECAGKHPRFFDNQKRSLLEQLPRLVKRHASPTRRNYLAMGSGFFESAQNAQSVPKVLQVIVESLKEQGLLTVGDPEIDIFVNPDACQAVANCLTGINEMGWTVRKPGKPEYFREQPRSLHAKFLFSANDSGSNNCNSPWVYLGSGNLTGPGFSKSMNSEWGNLEAGVVFDPGELYWYRKNNVEDQSLVTKLLPLSWDDQSVLNNTPSALQPGPEMPASVVQFIAAPIAWMWWIEGWLRPNIENASDYELLDANGHPCERDDRYFFRWPGLEQPPQVWVRWKSDGNEWKALTPVIDENGRIAAKPLRRLEIDDAWCQLASFPMLPDEEEIPNDAQEWTGRADAGGAWGQTVKARYAVRSMMELIENIADKQTSISKFDWTTWCARLEQCLGQAADSDVVQQFRKLGLNPLSPLWHNPFRPGFAETSATPEGQFYELTLARIEQRWQVADFPKIGGTYESELLGLERSGQTAETAEQ